MNISLPDTLKAWIEEQVEAGSYSTPSEFVRELLRAEQKRQAREELDRELLRAQTAGKKKARRR
jgi:antitoxin ParD1/3/4